MIPATGNFAADAVKTRIEPERIVENQGNRIIKADRTRREAARLDPNCRVPKERSRVWVIALHNFGRGEDITFDT